MQVTAIVFKYILWYCATLDLSGSTENALLKLFKGTISRLSLFPASCGSDKYGVVSLLCLAPVEQVDTSFIYF